MAHRPPCPAREPTRWTATRPGPRAGGRPSSSLCSFCAARIAKGQAPPTEGPMLRLGPGGGQGAAAGPRAPAVLRCRRARRQLFSARWEMSRGFDAEQFEQAAGDAIIAADGDGAIVMWNPAAERLLGHTEREALGRSLDLIIPERFRPRHWDGYRQVMQTGHTRYGTDVLRVPAVHKDGRTISIAFTVALLSAPAAPGRIIAAIVRDDTARWTEERALRQRLAELEARKA